MAVSLRRPKLIAYLALLSRRPCEQLGDELGKGNTTSSGQFLCCLFQYQRQDKICFFCFVTIEKATRHTPLLRTHGVLAILFFLFIKVSFNLARRINYAYYLAL